MAKSVEIHKIMWGTHCNFTLSDMDNKNRHVSLVRLMINFFSLFDWVVLLFGQPAANFTEN